MMSELIAAMPSSGMMPVDPDGPPARELLQLCAVMGWKPKLPLQVMRDEMARRWFLRGMPGAQDYWIRDSDIDVLRATPMWQAVLSAAPYGLASSTETAKARLDARKEIGEIIVGDPFADDPVEHDRENLAKARLEAEERLRKMDEWE